MSQSRRPPGRKPQQAPAQISPLLPDRLLIAAAVVLTGVVFLSTTADPVNIPKLSALLWCAILLAGSAAVRAVRSRSLTLPWGLPALAGIALVAAFVVATLVAPQSTVAVLGANGRNSGLLAYLAALALYLGVLRAFDAGATKILAFALLLAGLFTASYGLLQLVGWDSIPWANPFSPIIGTLGNPNFASAYLGITVPVAAWAACWTGWSRGWRIASAATGVLCLALATLSYSVQGPVAAAGGLAVVALALALNQPATRRPKALRLLVGGGVVSVGALVLLVVGPARSAFAGAGFQARVWYWEAAITMWQRSPLSGVGLDSYGLFWRRDQPLESPRSRGGDNYSDAAHSVPLQHLAQGGLILVAAYLLFLVVVSVALVRGMRRLAGQERLLLAGLGGAWVAYQVQSVVSIDQVPLLVLNYVLGAAVVVASGSSRTRELTLPGARVPAEPLRGRRTSARKPRRSTPVDVALLSVIGLVVVTGLWFALTPMRASHAAYRGDVAVNKGDGTAALTAYQQAVDLTPGVGMYRTRIGQTYERGSKLAEAQVAFAAAFDVDKAEIGAGRTAGRFAEAAGDYDEAGRRFAQALALDPNNSGTILDWATFQLRHGSAREAQARLERAVRDLPDEAGLWASLGDARGVFKDVAGARAAYERALALKADEPTAVAGLKKLDA